MITEKSWKEFRETGLLWFINTTLHAFGWVLVVEFSEKKILRVFPARTKFRGFSDDINTEGYIKLSTYLKNNSEQLEKEAKE